MWTIYQTLPDTYNYRMMLSRLTTDPLHYVDERLSTVKIPVTDGKVKEGVTLRFFETKNQRKVELTGDTLDKDAALQQSKNIFLWDRPLQNISAHFHETDLKPLFERFDGTPLVCEFEKYGCLMKTIIHQQLNMSFAYTLSTRFVQTYGEQSDGVWFYPDPETIAALDPSELQTMQFSRRKAEYVIDTSKLIAENKLDLERLEEAEDDQVIKQLTSIRGVGPWTAECFLLFGLGRQNLLPAGDVGIQNGLKRLWNRKEKPAIDEIKEKGKQWAPYASYATLYIWLSTEYT
ncbi:DNA-3-methyladenine glycosylase II [Salibacterium salarium]|uniref:DNA-3-methyladenine glycosylase family protein n=1 Tax=Salibacterium salarium TaxID=284579 RepID=UPI0027882F2D|nr:DNA-3-methyladenine glycosylase [Salibacterium salarium]MDQ0300817.1 DNA-3-methyladenine glycosylase II [Salibacterium salarium]